MFDAFTGHPAEVSSRKTTGMQMQDAVEMVEILNRIRPPMTMELFIRTEKPTENCIARGRASTERLHTPSV